jgi:Bacterial PH domain
MDGVPATAPPAQLSAVPRRLRQACAAVAAVVVVVVGIAALLLKSSSTGVVRFQTSDQVAVFLVGLAVAAGILALGRSRVDADAAGVRVRNVAGGRELPWSVVRAVRFDRKAAWASLQLTNGDEVPVLALMAVDRERAVAAVEGLRALLAASRGDRE